MHACADESFYFNMLALCSIDTEAISMGLPAASGLFVFPQRTLVTTKDSPATQQKSSASVQAYFNIALLTRCSLELSKRYAHGTHGVSPTMCLVVYAENDFVSSPVNV